MIQVNRLQKTIVRRKDRIATRALKNIIQGVGPSRRKHSTPKQKTLRILSIDGGGIRAILPAVILARLEERLRLVSGNPQVSILDYFDLFAGTSAGGVLTALYLTPDPDRPERPRYSAQQVLEIYLRDGGGGFTPINPDSGRSRQEKYSSPILETQLQSLLGEATTLGQLVKPALITAFNVDTESPVYFNSWEKTDCKAWQVVRATTAAPGLFLPASFEGLENGMRLMDGSVFAGNPTMCAYTLANHTRFSAINNCRFSADFPSRDDILLLSVGTGKVPKLGKKAGSLMRILMKNCMSSSSELIHYQLGQLYADQRKDAYFRFNPELSLLGSAIDKVEAQNIDALYELAVSYLAVQSNKMDRLVVSLMSR